MLSNARTVVVIGFPGQIFAFARTAAMACLSGTGMILRPFGRGRFLRAVVNSIWLVLTLSTAVFAVSTFFAKLFQAMRQPGEPGMSSFISFCLAAILCQIGIHARRSSVVAGALGVTQMFVLADFSFTFRGQSEKPVRLPGLAAFPVIVLLLCAVPVAAELSFRRGGLDVRSILDTILHGLLFPAVIAGLAWGTGLLRGMEDEVAA
nr:hypothetical protein [uncultured Gellertiella sp.]